MAAVGGDIIELTYNHPTLGSGTLFPKAGEDSTYDLGGFRATDDANMVDGSGAAITQLNRIRWFWDGTIANDFNVALEAEKMNDLAADPVDADWTVTHVNGSVYKGKGRPVGDIQVNGNQATFTLKVSGGGKLKKIV